jgi:LacI family transcriptional regulator
MRGKEAGVVDRSVTLAEVAEAAGVSVATASRSLNGSRDRKVREDLRLRVLDAAARLHYSPNTHAQAVARGQASVVGLVVHDITDPYFSAIASGVIRAAEEHDLMVTLATTYRSTQRELEYVRMLRSQRARSIVIVGSRFDDREAQAQLEEEAEMYAAAGGRMALVSQQRLPVDTVLVQNRTASRTLAAKLHELGHRRFAVLAGPSKLLTSTDRVNGFRHELDKLGCPVPSERVYRGAFTRDGGYEAMSRALDEGVDATCVFAVNDVMALGALAALRDRGVPLPDGMAVAGFDDIATLRDVTPRLTTVRLPMEEMGSEALRLTLSESRDEPRSIRVAGDVVLRESTPALSEMRPLATGGPAR